MKTKQLKLIKKEEEKRETEVRNKTAVTVNRNSTKEIEEKHK